jgi:predicted metal-dependent phosphotriesterase family hydrolase
LLGRVLLSHDDGWSIEGKPRGENLKRFGNPEPYTVLARGLVPMLRKAGLTEGEIDTMRVENPRQAFTVQRRLLSGPG